MPKTRRSARLLQKAASAKTSQNQVLSTYDSAIKVDNTSKSIPANARALVDNYRLLVERAISGREEEHERYAKQMERYFRNKFKFYGLKAPQNRSIQSQWIKEENFKDKMDRETLMGILYCLWNQEKREMQSTGCDLASKYKQLLVGENKDEFDEGLACVKHLLTTKSWWDTVDMLSYPVVGYMVKTRPEWGVPIVDKWISDENMWLRRSAILHQLQYKEETNQERLFRYCLSRCHEDEFFIRKAIGWALRQYTRVDPSAVKKFVEENKERLSNLSIKEALKHVH